MSKRTCENAARLAFALYQYHADKHTVKVLAEYLHYIPEQLEKDMKDIHEFVYWMSQIYYKLESEPEQAVEDEDLIEFINQIKSEKT